MFKIKAKKIYSFVAIAVVSAILLSLFAFIFHSKLHNEEHFHNHIKNACSDRLSKDINFHFHSSDNFPNQHADCECQICNLSYLDLFFNSVNKSDSFYNNYVKLTLITITNKSSDDVFLSRFLRSPPYCSNLI